MNHQSRAGRLTAVLALALVAGPWAARPLLGQSTDRSARLDALDRLVDSITPESGAPGTTVRVTTRDMPVGTPLRVGFGAPAGFEALVELLTGDEGDFDVQITVPAWATWDRAHLVVVFDIYFRPIARSAPFHVTNAEGLVQRRGTLVAAPAPCLLFRDVDGYEYELDGSPDLIGDLSRRRGTEPLPPITVTGRIERVRDTACGAGVRLYVTSTG